MAKLNNMIASIPMPERITRLPISPAGFPVPWFVQWFDNGQPCDFGQGVPDFRVADQRKLVAAVKQNRCYVCGEQLGQFKAFVIGPMCAINRTIAEPPNHRDCAIFSATACPFLSRPRMKRNTKDIPGEAVDAPGFGIKRNPGVACVWITKSYRLTRAHGGNAGVLFQLGAPTEVLWFAEGRGATRDEVMASIDSGYPLLLEMAEKDGPAGIAALAEYRERAMPLLPAECAS